jgi:hypothetical protein
MTLSREIVKRQPPICSDMLLATLNFEFFHPFNFLMNHRKEDILARVTTALTVLLEQPQEELSGHMNRRIRRVRVLHFCLHPRRRRVAGRVVHQRLLNVDRTDTLESISTTDVQVPDEPIATDCPETVNVVDCQYSNYTSGLDPA